MPLTFHEQLSNISSAFSQNFPPKPKWSVDGIPDLSGKVAIVTGGYAGIGYETTKALVSHSCKVYILGRSPLKAQEAINKLVLELREVERARELVHFVEIDLADLRSVRIAAEELKRLEPHFDILINNAGIMTPPTNKPTSQGIESQWGTNVLGPHFLTSLLLPSLLASPNKQQGFPRVVNVSGLGHQVLTSSNGVDFETLKVDEEELEKKMTMKDNERLFGQSKMGQVILSNQLHKRYASQGLVASALHPGIFESDLRRDRDGTNFLERYLMVPTATGALTQLWTATSEEGAKHGGKYLIPFCRIGQPHPLTHDPTLGEKVWEWLERECEGF